MSWKSDVHNVLQQLAGDIRSIRDGLKNGGACDVSIGQQIGAHVALLWEQVATLDEVDFKDVLDTSTSVKKAAIPLVQALPTNDADKISTLNTDFTNHVKNLNAAVKAAPDKATAKHATTAAVATVTTTTTTAGAAAEAEGGGEIDLEAVKKLMGEMKNSFLDVNRSYLDGDEEKLGGTMKTLLDHCCQLCALGTDGGCDVKKPVRGAYKKVESIRTQQNAEDQLQGALKEFHSILKDIEKQFKQHNEQFAGGANKPKAAGAAAATGGGGAAAKGKPKPKGPQSQIEAELNVLNKEIEKNDPTDLFTITKELGKGATGSVHAAVAKNGKVFAIKKVPLTLKTLGATNKEIKFMKRIQHENTLAYYSCYKKGNEVWIVMELCEGGSVQDILEKTGVGLDEKYIAAITQQVLNGLQYLHGQQTIHRDIKTGNLLLTSEGKVKIADFGASAEGTVRTTVIGSSYWMAPETLDQRGYDAKADIWSLGITLIEMAEKDPPYFNLQPSEVVRHIMHSPAPTLKNPAQWSNNFKEFVRFCLQKDPAKRLDAQTLLQHPFIKESDPSCLSILIEEVKARRAAAAAAAASGAPIATTASNVTPLPSLNNITSGNSNNEVPPNTPFPMSAASSSSASTESDSEHKESKRNSDKSKGSSSSSSSSSSTAPGVQVRRKSAKKQSASLDKSGEKSEKTEKSEKSSGGTTGSEKGTASSHTGVQRKSSKRSSSIKESKDNEEKIKVHLNSDTTVPKRIGIEANTDAASLCQKCQRHFKIEKSDASSYAMFVVQSSGGGEKKLEDKELPLEIAQQYKKEKKEEAKFIYKKC